jgi:hypothetical protein
VAAVLAIFDGVVSQVSLHLYDSGDLFILDSLEFGFGEFAAINGFTVPEDGLGTLEGTDVFGAEGRQEGPKVGIP